MGSNSGFTACEVTRSGVRQDGIQMAVKIIAAHAGIDSFTCGWIHAGGDVDFSGGQWRIVGRTDTMLPTEFAKAVKMQSRVTEALKKGLIVEAPRTVIRPDNTRSAGYRVGGAGSVVGASVGGGVKAVARDAGKQLADDNCQGEMQSTESKKVGMPDDFMDSFGLGDS